MGLWDYDLLVQKAETNPLLALQAEAFAKAWMGLGWVLARTKDKSQKTKGTNEKNISNFTKRNCSL